MRVRTATRDAARSFPLLLAIAAMLLLTWLAQPVRAASVSPSLVPGNPTCGSLIPGATELKVEPVASGQYSQAR